MTKALPKLQELRKRIYACAKADKQHRFWGLYVHVYKTETLKESYKRTKANNGAPGIDGMTFEQIEENSVDNFIEDIQKSLRNKTYRPMRNRIKEIPKAGDSKSVRKLGIPCIRDRVVQGALKLIIEPVFEADFQEGSYGYRPGRKQHDAVQKVQQAIIEQKTRVIDLDLKAYFDTVKHHLLLNKIAERISDPDILHLIKMMLQATGKEGVPQGGVASALFANIYLNEVDKMLEKAITATSKGKYTHLSYARFADDLIILVDAKPKWHWLYEGIIKRLKQELKKLQLIINETKTRYVDLGAGESFVFLGFEMRMIRTYTGKWRANMRPSPKKKQALITELREVFRRNRSQKLTSIRDKINPILRGWVNYFRVGHSSEMFRKVRFWLNLKIRRHLMRSMMRGGYGWKRWSTNGLFAIYNIYDDYKLVRWKAAPTNRP
ncbi:MAG: group II intron reverse transcriptase/maturase [Chitinophagaceae bacterium]|nr:group II intron reverse transcriptase/maturase [Chitinophagaceae bacterium]